MNKRAWLIVLTFFIWSVISWNWYTCGIKGFCESTQLEPTSMPDPKTDVYYEFNKSEPIVTRMWESEMKKAKNEKGNSRSINLEIPFHPTENEKVLKSRAAKLEQLLKSELDFSFAHIEFKECASCKIDGKISGVQWTWFKTDDRIRETENMVLIYFPYKSDALSSDKMIDRYLEELAYKVKSQNALLHIVGHTDDKGSEGYNEELGLQRAAAVKGILLAKGIPSASITIESKGENDPLVPNSDEQSRQKNRRTEIRIVQ